MVGQTISHYKILEKLGEGGMGVVYKAEDIKLKRVVALKFLSSAIQTSSEEMARFKQEAIAISSLNHPHIATLFDLDETSDAHFIVLEYIAGGTLKDKIAGLKGQGKEFSIDEIMMMATQIAEGLAHAHRRQITHRDIKTDNIMVSEEGNMKITDFSLALLKGVSNLTRVGTTLGTAAYMSPEQIKGEAIDHRTDIFSFGIVLYELTTFRRPFRGEHEASLAYSIVHEEPPPLKKYRENVPERLESIIKKCLEKETENRYQTVDEIVADLKAKEQTPVVETQKPVVEIPKEKVVHVKARWIISAAVIVVVGIGLYFLLGDSPLLSGKHKIVAVLPFRNMSGIADDEYFCDGVTEDIITQIGKIADLKVISRTTMMHYKGTKKTLPEIAKELNVGVVLEGSIRHIANQIRISAQLINAETDEQLWAETYDKDFSQVFEIQSDVALKIASALQAKLTPGEQKTITKKPTENTVAYNFYLRGNEYLKRTTKADNEIAIGFYKKALELDSKYSTAWAGLSSGYLRGAYLYNYGINWLDSAKVASETALAFDDNSADAYNALASVYHVRGMYDTALVYYKKAVSCDPNYFSVMQNIGQIYFLQGSLDDALVWMKRAVTLGPTEAGPRTDISRIYISIGEYDKAEYWLKSALELDPNSAYSQLNLANIYAYQQKNKSALDLIKKIVQANPDDALLLGWCSPVVEMTGNDSLAISLYETSIKLSSHAEPDPNNISFIGLGRMLLKKGKAKEANDLFAKAEKVYQSQIDNGNKSPDIYYSLASVNSIRGNKKEALDYLQKSIDCGFRDYYIAESDSYLENIKNEQRFHLIMATIKSKIDDYKIKIEKLEK